MDKFGTTEVVGGIIVLIFSIWIAAIQSTVKTVTELKPQIERVQYDVSDLTKWRDHWVSDGMLPLDVTQNENIKQLQEKVNDIEDLDLEARLARMELLLSQIHSELVKNQ